MSHRSDTGPFALVPVWVLDLPISHLAVRVYAVHADWADRAGAHHHGRKAIAERLGCSLDAVDVAHKALVAHRALRIEGRRDAAGDPTSNLYWVCRMPPGVAVQERLPSRTGAATGSQAGAALTRSKASNYLNQSDAPPEPVEKPLPLAEVAARARALRRQERTG
jgi:hypothetical protein